MTTIDETTAPDLIWGCSAIAKAIGQSERATFHLLKKTAPASQANRRALVRIAPEAARGLDWR
jgi:hypothetical protein